MNLVVWWPLIGFGCVVALVVVLRPRAKKQPASLLPQTPAAATSRPVDGDPSLSWQGDDESGDGPRVYNCNGD